MADEPVVVNKSRPEKQGNHVEEENRDDLKQQVLGSESGPKVAIVAKGGSSKEV